MRSLTDVSHGHYLAPQAAGNSGLTLIKQWLPAKDYSSPDGAHTNPQSFFAQRIQLPAGEYACLIQLQLDPMPVSVASMIRVEARVLAGGRVVLDGREVYPGNAEASIFDDLVLRFRLAAPAVVELCGIAVNVSDGVRLRHMQLLAVSPFAVVSRDAFREKNAVFKTDYLKTLFIGTSNLCNANCHHCPTNKKMTSHLARGAMSDAVFDTLLDGIADITVNEACFGLFGEPFNDPGLEARVHRLADAKPGMMIDIATNAGIIELGRLRAILDRVRRIAIHVEAVAPSRYNKLMAPLQADEVLPRIDELVALCPGKVLITTPLHQGNLVEARGIVERWASRGAEVRFSPLQTRVTDKTGARRVALAPTPGFWSTDLLDIFVVDWDGQVFLTCDDFLRRQPLGDLNQQSVAEIMGGAVRRAAFDDIAHYRWHKLPSLADAMIDAEKAVQEYARVSVGESPSFFHLQPKSFQINPPAQFVDDAIVLGHSEFAQEMVSPQVFGPYLELRTGRYMACFSFELEDMKAAPGDGAHSELVCEVVAGYGRHQYKIVREPVRRPGTLEIHLDFDHDAASGPVEFRVYASLPADELVLRFRTVEILRHE